MTGIESFRDARSVETCADDVYDSHGDEPGHGTNAESLIKADREQVVHSWHDSDAAEADEHAGAHHTELGLAEFIPQRYHYACRAASHH